MKPINFRFFNRQIFQKSKKLLTELIILGETHSARICILAFIAVITVLYIFTSNIYSYIVLFDHDFLFSFNRVFWLPEHGRYIATFTNSVFVERLPVLLNIHFNDFNGLVTNHFKSFLFLFLVLLMTASAFTFKKKEKTFCSMFFSNYVAVIFFISLFVILFSNQYFLNVEFLQNVIFFEYPMSFLPYIPFWSIIIFLYTKNITKLRKSTVFLLFTLSFFTGLSIENLNFATFVSLTILSLIMFIKRKDFNLQKKNLLFIFYLDITYIISILIYYMRGNDHTPDYGPFTFWEYVYSNFSSFLKEFFELFFITNSKMLILIFVILALIFKFSKEKQSRKFISIISINIFSIILFHFITFFFGFTPANCIDGFFWASYQKFVMLYKMSLIFYLLVSIGYLTDEVLKISPRKQDLLKLMICLTPMLLFNKFVIFVGNIKPFTEEQKEYKKYAYIAEKTAIQQTAGEKIVLPLKIKKKIFRTNPPEAEMLLFNYYFYLHPEEFSEKKQIIFSSEEKIDMGLFSDEELKELKFSKLLKYPLKKTDLNIFQQH